MPKRAQVTPANDEGPVELDKGRIVGRRWKIIEKLGEGGCGSVYKVQDIQTMAKVRVFTPANDEGPVELDKGRIVGRRWKIIEKLGEGGCGSVYKVQDIQTMAKVLRRLEGRRYIAELLQAGKKSTYSYMVMTLFGHSLNCLLKKCGQCSISTQVRVGINILYGIKQLHEVGHFILFTALTC
ncbi:unnamed protein product [Toxocara canis]|uniref:Protein kinase domain-containing protein n=1 Tax=Toxocara canis TaxID=6265 RepID=A0A183VGD8_TOXCA|nr:unnamed protein product [Toxocara canis]